jgi:phosphomannomutase
LDDLFKKVGAHYYDRVDVHITEQAKPLMIERITHNRVQKIGTQSVSNLDTRDGFRYKLDNGSWLLIRFSGTEPLIRIYAESNSNDEVQKLLQIGQEMAGA